MTMDKEGMDFHELVAVLKEALSDDNPNANVLVRRIPVICNDVLWIKRALIGLYVLIGTGLVGLILSQLGATVKI